MQGASVARQQGRGLTAVAEEAGAALLGGSSLKAALDLNWDEPVACAQALTIILTTLETVETYVGQQALARPAAAEVADSLAVAAQVRAQDVTADAAGQPVLRQGVAPDRRISVADADMRHGRKSASRLIDGYKRHILHDLDSALVRAVGLTPANAPEAGVTDAIMADLTEQQVVLRELHIDRAYLSSTLVRDRTPDLAIYCKAWPVRHGPHFAKTAFTLDWQRQTLRCPHDVELPFELGGTVHFPAGTCAACPLREQCTASARGRSVTIHPDERLRQELRERELTAQGRAKLRERVAIEHDLAYVFAIWGIIYTGLTAFAIFQALPGQRENPRLRRIGGLFVVASLANCAWIFAWHYRNFPLSMLCMLVLLAALIGIYLRLGTGRTRVSRAETWAVRVPFSIYLGWITVATIANAAQLLYVQGWDGWGIAPVTWTIIMLAAAVVVVAWVAVTRRDVAYLAVPVWALIGIALRQTPTPAVSLAAWVATGLVVLLLVWSAVRPIKLNA